MKISKITQQLKQPDRYSVFVDDKYCFSLSEAALLDSKLASGQELSADQLASYKQLSADDKMYGRALRYAAMRLRSEWEMQAYLERKGAAPDFIEQTLAKLRTIGLLDDANFANSFVRDRQLLRPSSKRKLMAELKKKRIPSTYMDQALGQEVTNEQAALQEVIRRKRRQLKYQDDLKLMQYLARQGFRYDDIKSALGADISD